MTIVLSIENEFVLCDTLTLMKHRLSESDPMTWGSTAVPLWLPGIVLSSRDVGQCFSVYSHKYSLLLSFNSLFNSLP